MQFRGDGGHTYEIEVKKGPTRTRLGGEGWRQFIAHHHLTGDNGEMVCFWSVPEDPVRTITVIYLNNNGSEEEEDEEEEELPLSPLVSQRCKLIDGENEHL